jgi:hypothetical protein
MVERRLPSLSWRRASKEHIAARLKPRTAPEYRRNLRRFILPAIGRLRVADVKKADIARLHHELRHIPYQAHRNLQVISKMFNLADRRSVLERRRDLE